MRVSEALARALQYQTPEHLKRPRPVLSSVPATVAQSTPRGRLPVPFSAYRRTSLLPPPPPPLLSPSDSEDESSDSDDENDESESESESEDSEEEEWSEGTSTDSTTLMPRKKQNQRRSPPRREVIVLDSDSEDEGAGPSVDDSQTWAVSDESQAFEGVTVLGSGPTPEDKEEEEEAQEEQEEEEQEEEPRETVEDFQAALYREDDDEDASRCAALAARQRELEAQEEREIEGVRRSLARVSLAAAPAVPPSSSAEGADDHDDSEQKDAAGLGCTGAERVRRWRVGPLTAAEMACVEGVLRRRRGERADRVCATLGDASVTHRDVQCLRPGEWLNDEVVNFFGALLNDRDRRWHAPITSSNNDASDDASKAAATATATATATTTTTMCETLPHCHVFSTFFYTALTTQKRYNYARVRKWTKSIDVFRYDKLLVPVNLEVHWCLAVVNLRDRQFEYYDSLQDPRRESAAQRLCVASLRQWLVDEWADKRPAGVPRPDVAAWRDVMHPAIPHQQNGHDCGVFACTFAECITRGARFAFDQRDMKTVRALMVYEIYTRRLKSELA